MIWNWKDADTHVYREKSCCCGDYYREKVTTYSKAQIDEYWKMLPINTKRLEDLKNDVANQRSWLNKRWTNYQINKLEILIIVHGRKIEDYDRARKIEDYDHRGFSNRKTYH